LQTANLAKNIFAYLRNLCYNVDIIIAAYKQVANFSQQKQTGFEPGFLRSE